jgi:hypothetical protein
MRRFIETAEEVGADDADALTRAFEKLRDEKTKPPKAAKRSRD